MFDLCKQYGLKAVCATAVLRLHEWGLLCHKRKVGLALPTVGLLLFNTVRALEGPTSIHSRALPSLYPVSPPPLFTRLSGKGGAYRRFWSPNPSGGLTIFGFFAQEFSLSLSIEPRAFRVQPSPVSYDSLVDLLWLSKAQQPLQGGVWAPTIARTAKSRRRPFPRTSRSRTCTCFPSRRS